MSPYNSRWVPEQYQLLDFGDGRKLERFGAVVLDRPSPAAEGTRKARVEQWSSAHFSLDEKVGESDQSTSATVADSKLGELPPWQIAFEAVTFNLKITPFGHLGVFPEQANNWRWLNEQLAEVAIVPNRPVRALNLFAYTGGTTLILAAAGAHVVHVDASAPAVNWARQNASSSGLADRPIRWIAEDARKFVAREVRRGNRYDIIVMDPPSYGHGPTGKRWMIEEHLPDLLRESIGLLQADGDSRLLLTAHSEQPSMNDIAGLVSQCSSPRDVAKGRLNLVDLHSRSLDAGFFVRASY